MWEKSEEEPICVWIYHWKNSLNPFGKIGENIDMTYMCWYSTKSSFKTQWGKYKEKMIWNINDCKLIREKPWKEKLINKFECK